MLAALRLFRAEGTMRRFFPPRSWAGLLLLLSWACAPGAMAQDRAAPGDMVAESVTLRPGDVVRVRIWREDDLSGEFPVDEDGAVVLPLLGKKQVGGMTGPRLRDELMEAYAVHLRNPSISIIPLRRLNILGEVGRPGIYQVDPTVSLAEAVALAGGATGAGDLDRIVIVREGKVMQKRVSAQHTINAVDLRSGDQIIVQQRSWFERNSTFVISLLLSVTSIVINLAR